MNYSKLSKNEILEIVKLNDSIINNVPIGFCITDKDGFFEFVNKAYCDIYGYKKRN